MLYRITFVICFFLLSACSSYVPITGCNTSKFTLDTQFENARANECRIVDGTINILITPENSPINDSPWYAFRVKSKQVKLVKFAISYNGGSQRYLPKVSHDGISWQILDYKVERGVLEFSLEVGPEATFVAGQELVTNADYVHWMDKLASVPSIRHVALGLSTKSRSIGALEVKGQGNEWLVILGRQHPPEVTGALALFPFVEALLTSSPLQRQFSDRFNLLVIPNLNPDGVALGYWRHNANGVDLNRDWKEFRQVEPRLVRNKLKAITAQGGNIVFAVDFHSTHKDIFYTMPVDYGLKPATFVEEWFTQLEKNVSPFVVRQKPGNNPDNGVFKQYIADQYDVHAITYEMGDNTDRDVIHHIADEAARSLMQSLLSRSKAAFTREGE